MNKRIWLAASLLALSGSANAAVVFSDNFEGDAAGLSLTTLQNFKVTDGVTVDVVSPATAGGYGMSVTSKVVDLDGTPGPATITSKDAFSFAAGDLVTLTFDLSGSQRGNGINDFSALVLFTSATSYSGLLVNNGSAIVGPTSGSASSLIMTSTVAANDPFVSRSFSFTALDAGSLKIAFGTTSHDNVGPLLDNVVLDIAPVPEPASWALMIGGFALAGASMRRRKVALRFA